MKTRYVNWKTKRLRAEVHRILHNDNSFFYTLSPMLLVAIERAFDFQRTAQTDVRMLDKHGYYEFGLFRGFSFWFAEQLSRLYGGSEFFCYGFDSFEGLPHSAVDKDVHWAQGNYAASYAFVMEKLKENGTDLSRTNVFKGWYSKEYFDTLTARHSFLPISICVIDSDTYESCAAVLEFVKPLLVPGSILLFDDYNAFHKDDRHGERRALIEFEQHSPSFQKEYLFDFGWHGTCFKVVSI